MKRVFSIFYLLVCVNTGYGQILAYGGPIPNRALTNSSKAMDAYLDKSTSSIKNKEPTADLGHTNQLNCLICDTLNLPSDGTTITTSSCSGILYDAGGTGSYSGDIDGTIVINPVAATSILVNFLSFHLGVF